MLALRPSCEQCDCDLAPGSTNAMICSYECTFCSDCVAAVLQNVCPNCGGELVRRPVRPMDRLGKNPASIERVFNPMGGERLAKHAANVLRYRAIAPTAR